LSLALGPGEDHREAAAIGLQHSREQLNLVHRVCTPDMLLDRIDRGPIITRVSRADVGRLLHVAACQGDDLPGHGR